jgi:hypothetical protein
MLTIALFVVVPIIGIVAIAFGCNALLKSRKTPLAGFRKLN